jgi:outer membrane lipoprotein-sorting protein
MQYLRRISARRLLALCAVVVALGAGGAAIAIAGSAGGPTPPPKPLDVAIHDALTAPAPDGVSARIHFTNKLVDASSFEGADPILTGVSGRLWASPDGDARLRIELQSDGGSGDTQVLLDGDRFMVYESGSNTAYKGTLPKDAHAGDQPDQPPTLEKVRQMLEKIAGDVTLSGATPTNVAGEPAYSVRVTPKHDGGLVGAAELAWDAAHGTPLRAAVYAVGRSDPVLELEATSVSFGPVPTSTFDIAPPPGAKVVELDPGNHAGNSDTEQAPVTGLEAVQKQVPFTISAPDSVAGMARSQVRLIAMDKDPAALVTYGKGLGGIAVLESQAGQGKAPSATSGDHHGGLTLPHVSINGAPGEELGTALGTLLRFERDGVSYVVLGSVPPKTAEAAARAL